MELHIKYLNAIQSYTSIQFKYIYSYLIQSYILNVIQKHIFEFNWKNQF